MDILFDLLEKNPLKNTKFFKLDKTKKLLPEKEYTIPQMRTYNMYIFDGYETKCFKNCNLNI